MHSSFAGILRNGTAVPGLKWTPMSAGRLAMSITKDSECAPQITGCKRSSLSATTSSLVAVGSTRSRACGPPYASNAQKKST